MSHPNFFNIASIISRTRGDSVTSLAFAMHWPHFLLLPTCPLEVGPIFFYAVDSVFQPPVFMISSTTVPVRNVLGEPLTRKECIMKWFSSSAARQKFLNIYFEVFVVSPPAQAIHMFEQLPVSHDVQLRSTKALHRCFPLIDTGRGVCLGLSAPMYSLFQVSKVKCFESCWN